MTRPVSRLRRTPLPTRESLLETLAHAGRDNSDATVIFHAALAERLDLNPTDYKAMSVLERLGPLSAGEIARHTGLTAASVTDLLDRLERKGFIRRIHDTKDRRRVLAEPIATRVSETRRRFVSTRQSLARLYERYTDAELAVIADFLSRNAERLRSERRKLDPESE